MERLKQVGYGYGWSYIMEGSERGRGLDFLEEVVFDSFLI